MTASPAVVADPPLDRLAARVAGTLHRPGDPAWDAVRTPWAVHVDQRPLAVLEAAGTADVVTAVRWCAEHGVPVTAQPGGHGATGAFEDVLLVRTRALAEIAVDRERRTAWVGAGVKSGELLAALDGTGLTFMVGSNPDVTVVGMTLTGGIGWFGRRHGVACESLRRVELVDGTGTLRSVDATEDPELFWALRGGGGDFGIVTGVEIDLHPVPELYGGRLMWPIEQMRGVLEAFGEVTRTAPDGLTVWFHAYRFPPLPVVPEPLRGKAFVGVAVVHAGSAAEAEALLAPFRALPEPVLDVLGELPVGALGAVADEPVDPMPTMEGSALVDRFDAALVDRLLDLAGPDADCPFVVVQLRHLGGAFADHRDGHGCHGPVPEPYNLFAFGVPVSPEVAGALDAGFARMDAALAEHASGRALLNFLGSHGDPGRWWSPAVRERLVRAKAAADPHGIVRSNRPVTGRPVTG